MGFGTEASLPDRLAFAERFGVRLVEGYGSSEGGINIIATADTPLGALGPHPAGMDVVVVTGRGILAHFQISDTREQYLSTI